MYTHHQTVGFIGHQWVGLFSPVLKDLGISQGPPWLFQLVILERQAGVGDQQEHFPLHALWGGGMV